MSFDKRVFGCYHPGKIEDIVHLTLTSPLTFSTGASEGQTRVPLRLDTYIGLYLEGPNSERFKRRGMANNDLKMTSCHFGYNLT